MILYFLSSDDIPNYKDVAGRYEGNTMLGKHCSTVYPYWILYNRGYKNVSLIKHGNDAPVGSYIYFHYDDRDKINLKRNRGIQFVSDRSTVSDCEIYIACNRFLIKPTYNKDLIEKYGIENCMCKWVTGNWFYTPHPFSQGVKKCTPQWPPSVFGFYGRPHTLISEITSKSFIDEMYSNGINIRINDQDPYTGNDHVTFCVRNHDYISTTTSYNNVDTKHGHKHAGRLFQTWAMNVPGIFELNSSMLSYRQNDTDFLIANDATEFKEACLLLRDNEDLYWSMVETCKRRAGTGSNDDFVEHLKAGLNNFGIKLYD